MVRLANHMNQKALSQTELNAIYNRVGQWQDDVADWAAREVVLKLLNEVQRLRRQNVLLRNKAQRAFDKGYRQRANEPAEHVYDID